MTQFIAPVAYPNANLTYHLDKGSSRAASDSLVNVSVYAHVYAQPEQDQCAPYKTGISASSSNDAWAPYRNTPTSPPRAGFVVSGAGVCALRPGVFQNGHHLRASLPPAPSPGDDRSHWRGWRRRFPAISPGGAGTGKPRRAPSSCGPSRTPTRQTRRRRRGQP